MHETTDLRIYETADGQTPFVEWEKGLDSTAKGAVRARLNRLRIGNFGDCKPVVGAKIFELRIDYGPGYRIYFAKQGRKLVILLCGGNKRGQNRDIKKASEYWQDYQSRTDED
ncbi:MAG: type II toxin-antitoxin system RelE/ParE family toxin [Chlamydiales bacterium]|nr:type II toxin-antitoxin system RelE/ParE family toxin [Chlamydiales bacterium]